MISNIIDAIQSAFSGFGTAFITMVKTLFNGLIFADGTGTETALSNIAIFGFVFLSISLVLSVCYWVVGLVRRKI